VRLPHLKEEARGVIWVDLLEVKARILFEQLIQSKKGLGKSQQLLIPLTFSFSQAEAAQLMTCLPDLNELGIVVRAIGPTAFMVEAIPTCLVEKDLQALFHAMISHEESGVKERERAICRGVSTSGKTFSLTEGVALFKQWMAMADWQQSPQGNPIIYFMSKDEITKLF
jgi:DNA mismatch repair protein MutL